MLLLYPMRSLTRVRLLALLLASTLLMSVQAAVPIKPPEQEINRASVFLTNNIDRPLRYTPVGTDFVITNGGEFFNRPLYGGGGAVRVDAGDIPEFSIYARGRGGNLRVGVRVDGRSVWLHQMNQIIARYRPGAMEHEIRDPMLGEGVLNLQSIGTRTREGLPFTPP